MCKTRTIKFVLGKKDVLNSNSMPSKVFLKSRMASHLRKTAHVQGTREHENSVLSVELLDYHLSYKEAVQKRSKLSKRLPKDISSADRMIALAEVELPLKPLSLNDFPYMFHNFNVDVVVCSPTARRLDPSNLYPSVKPLIDGLTDCGWWEDDDYTRLKKMSFSYGGKSTTKDCYTLSFTITENCECSSSTCVEADVK